MAQSSQDSPGFHAINSGHVPQGVGVKATLTLLLRSPGFCLDVLYLEQNLFPSSSSTEAVPLAGHPTRPGSNLFTASLLGKRPSPTSPRGA